MDNIGKFRIKKLLDGNYKTCWMEKRNEIFAQSQRPIGIRLRDQEVKRGICGRWEKGVSSQK